MSLTQKVPSTALTLGDRTIRVPNQVVARAPSSAVNTLSDNQMFVSVGGNGTLETSPPIVHFGGFRTENIHELTVRVINKSDTKQRIHVLPPQTSSFKFDVANNGFIRPGLAQDITITFRPSEYRYYYDCIRLHCPGQNILVPIHAYPVVAKINCPATLDFGMVPIGQELEKSFSFSCDVPIQFEYKLSCLDANSDFIISPMLGIVPAEGTVQVNVLFRPTRLYTSLLKISVSLSQFGFSPFTMQLRGNSLPPDPMPKPPSVEDPSYMGPRIDKIMTAVHDAARDRINQASRSACADSHSGSNPEGKKKKVNPATMTLLGGKEEEVDGLYLPEELDNWANSMYVLTQTKGKLKLDAAQSSDPGVGGSMEASGSLSDPKAITRAAVAAVSSPAPNPHHQRSLSLQINATTEAKFEDVEVAWGGGAAGCRIQRQLAELKFKQEIDTRLEYDKAKAVKWLMAPGLIEISAQDIAAAHTERNARDVARKAEERAISRAIHDTAPSAVKVTSVVGATIRIEPTFDIYLNDAWRVRKEVLGKFVSHVRSIVIQQRLERRIALLNPKAEASPAATLPSSSSSSSSAAAAKSSSRISPDKIIQRAIPIYREENFADRTAVNAEHLEYTLSSVGRCSTHGIVDGSHVLSNSGISQDFRDWPILPIKVQPTYKLLAYTPQKPVPCRAHIPLETERALRVGGEDEYPVRGPRGSAAVAAAVVPPTIPQVFLLAPATPTPAAIPHLDPNDTSVTYATGIVEVETALEYVLRPYDRSAGSKSSSSNSMLVAAASLLGLKTPSSFYLPRKSEIACIADPLPELLAAPLPADLAQLVPVAPQDDDDKAAAAGAGGSPPAPPVTPAPPSVEAINAFSIPPLDLSQDDAGLVARNPWVSALRETEKGFMEARTRLTEILPRKIEEYNAAVSSEYFKVKL